MRRMLIMVLATLFLALPVSGAELYHMVRITEPGPVQIQAMAELGLPLDDSRLIETETGKDMEIPLSETDIDALAQRGIAHRIVQEDLEAQ